MSDKLKDVLEAALSLSIQERTEAVAIIIESLDEEAENADIQGLSPAWAAEVERRWEEHLRGDGKSVPVQEIRDMLKRRDRA